MENLLKVSEIAGLMGVTPFSARRALRNYGVDLVPVKNTFAADRNDVIHFLATRLHYSGRGRPKGARNKTLYENTNIEFVRSQLSRIKEEAHATGLPPDEVANRLLGNKTPNTNSPNTTSR